MIEFAFDGFEAVQFRTQERKNSRRGLKYVATDRHWPSLGGENMGRWFSRKRPSAYTELQILRASGGSSNGKDAYSFFFDGDLAIQINREDPPK
jgi:hypothetical protein